MFSKENTPLLCVPITGKTESDITSQFTEVISQSPDMVEWRADFFEHLHMSNIVIDLINNMKSQTNIPLLFTIRSEREGGEQSNLTEEKKVELIERVCSRTDIDFIDYEVMNESKYVRKVVDGARKAQVQLILSYHNFQETPCNNELIKIATRMEFYGANYAKLAVMPENKQDVYRLLHVTSELNELLTIPIITMSMGELGALSRVIGWAYGSCLTFAVGIESSAPGQLPLEKLRTAIHHVQEIAQVDYK